MVTYLNQIIKMKLKNSSSNGHPAHVLSLFKKNKIKKKINLQLLNVGAENKFVLTSKRG